MVQYSIMNDTDCRFIIFFLFYELDMNNYYYNKLTIITKNMIRIINNNNLIIIIHQN